MQDAKKIKKRQRWLGPGEVSRRLGVTIKALRVYETAGLVTPDRRESGWRLYGSEHIKRLNRILLLKGLGLSLPEIGALLDAPESGLAETLALQEQYLARQLAELRQRFDIVARARRRAKSQESFTLDELMTLAAAATPIRPLDAQTVEATIKGLAAGREFSEEYKIMEAELLDAGIEPAPFEQSLRDLMVDASVAACAGDIESPESVALAKRWADLVAPLLGRQSGLFGEKLMVVAHEMRSRSDLSPAFRYLREAIAHHAPEATPQITRKEN